MDRYLVQVYERGSNLGCDGRSSPAVFWVYVWGSNDTPAQHAVTGSKECERETSFAKGMKLGMRLLRSLLSGK